MRTMIECQHCEGTGKVKRFLVIMSFNTKCDKCNGEGYIKMEDIVTRPVDMDMTVANTIWDDNGNQ